MNNTNANNNDNKNMIIITFFYSGQSISLIATVISEKR